MQPLSGSSSNALSYLLLDEILLMLCFGISFPKKRCLVWVNFKSYPLQMKNISEMPVLEFHSPVSRGGRKLFCRADGTVSQTLISINQCSFIEVKEVIFHVRSWPSILSAAVLDWHRTRTPGWRRHLMHAGIPTSVATASLFFTIILNGQSWIILH